MELKGKRLKIVGTLLGVTMMSAVLSGCGGQKNADDANTIKIGANFELTGNAANYGSAALDGLRLAVKEVNDAGGIDGKKIELEEVDSKSEASESANATTKLVTDKVSAIVGPATTGDVLASSPIVTDSKIPLIAPAATSPKVTVDDNGKVKPFVFRSCFIDPQQGEVMSTFAVKTLHAKTAVIYVDSSTDYSKSLGKVFREKFEASGGQIVDEEAFVQKDQDFKTTLTKIKAANPDIIFIPAYYEEVGKIVKQARELGITAPLLGTDGWDDTKVIDIAGKDPLNNTFYSTHYSDQDKDVQNFIKMFEKENNGKEPNVFAALGYDAGKMLIEAIKQAKSSDPQKIRDALENLKDIQVGTGVISINKDHNPIKSAVIIEMKDGNKVMREKIAPEN
ncbi:ABC transporter substrate-binding protein [Pectinatus haikarae]|uniref:Branched-chain amino acid transport system substrate-binding protein n=1 Tax=Pectinatus haikarae TaxID=349096 RepID=A0ABT9Y597_9FIRM|nr:ABC transporter substrate-binding protein [Pectinatus haikarae]MDQ0203003.1 branched-chain amino acid transport system substrate-binding protein [Pectinatus haikarae]